MKQIYIRLLFGVFILAVNILIILIVGNTQLSLFKNYEMDLNVLISFLGLLFLEPSLFNPFFCSIKTQKSINESDNESIIVHKINYRGKDPLNVTVKVHSAFYDVECTRGETEEIFIPIHANIHLSGEKPNETLTFRLKRKESCQGLITGKKATIKYKKEYLIKKIHVI